MYDSNCDGAGTSDFAVVFTAPASATYRFDAAGVDNPDDPVRSKPCPKPVAPGLALVSGSK